MLHNLISHRSSVFVVLCTEPDQKCHKIERLKRLCDVEDGDTTLQNVRDLDGDQREYYVTMMWS